MNSKTKTILLIGGFAVFIAVAAFAYNTLQDKVDTPSPLTVTSDEGDGELANNETTEQNNDAEQANSDAAETSEGDTDSAEEQEKLMAYDFIALDNDGNEVKLSDYYGKPVVVNFWASWCPPCKSEMPEFEKVYKEMGEDINFLMVDLVGGQETMEKGKDYIAEMEYTFPVFFDTEQDAAMNYGITSIPTTLFIDKDGYVATGAQGAIDEDTLRLGISYITEE